MLIFSHLKKFFLLSNNHNLVENNKNFNKPHDGNGVGNDDRIDDNNSVVEERNQINSQNSEQYLVVAGMDNTNGSSSSDIEMENGHTTNGCYKNGNSTLNDSIDGDEEMGIYNFF